MMAKNMVARRRLADQRWLVSRITRFTCGLPDDMEQIRRGLVHAYKNPVQKRKKSKIPKKRRV